MFTDIPQILTADQLIDRAIKKSMKIIKTDRDPRYRYKKTIIARTESIGSFLTELLDSYVKKFPSIENIHPFYQEIIQLHISVDKLKKALGAVQWASQTIKRITKSQLPALRRTLNKQLIQTKNREILGRISSVLKQIDDQLIILVKAQMMLKDLPEIQDIPTIVIAGYPNVGKSSLLRKLSNAKPAVAQYPFTTQKIYVGHMNYKENHISHRIQLIDTPGLLDRPLSKRNTIEKEAIAALRYLADIILLISDPSETCGYTLTNQEQLHQQVVDLFPQIPLIEIENKSDIKSMKSDKLKISCVDNQGIEEVKKLIIKLIKNKDT
jgi:nucleolar GTP-binding protein